MLLWRLRMQQPPTALAPQVKHLPCWLIVLGQPLQCLRLLLLCKAWLHGWGAFRSSSTGRLLFALCLIFTEGSNQWHRAVLLILAKVWVSISLMMHCWCNVSGIEQLKCFRLVACLPSA